MRGLYGLVLIGGLLTAQELRFPPRIGPYPGVSTYVPPEIIYSAPPEYTKEASLAGLEGTVWIRASIDERGGLHDSAVYSGIGLGLNERALQSIASWKYHPAKIKDGPIAVPVLIGVDFHLPSHLSRWHLAKFDCEKSDESPHFRLAPYPTGPGLDPADFDQGRILAVIHRFATAKIRFQVRPDGVPVEFEILNESDKFWGPEAISVIRKWRFSGGSSQGNRIPVKCEAEMAWGSRERPPEVPPPEPADKQPRALVTVEPTYSEFARDANLEGRVVFTLDVDDTGIPHNARIRDSIIGLDQEALEAVRQWRFEPAAWPGASPRVAVIEFQFSLDGAGEHVAYKQLGQ